MLGRCLPKKILWFADSNKRPSLQISDIV
ncbi:hypothetical protein YPPY103_2163, partial [Yersinia pestis PY-103]